jgi:hypothetical protein
MLRRRGLLVIASASRPEDPGFEYRQCVIRFLPRSLYIPAMLSKLNMYCHCECLRKLKASNFFKIKLKKSSPMHSNVDLLLLCSCRKKEEEKLGLVGSFIFRTLNFAAIDYLEFFFKTKMKLYRVLRRFK